PGQAVCRPDAADRLRVIRDIYFRRIGAGLRRPPPPGQRADRAADAERGRLGTPPPARDPHPAHPAALRRYAAERGRTAAAERVLKWSDDEETAKYTEPVRSDCLCGL